MASVVVRDRIARVEGPGVVIVASDLHGNLADFRRVVELWRAEEDAVLFLLGDFVHGPNVERQTWEAELSHLGEYYLDQSPDLFRELEQLMSDNPSRVACLLGNHEHGHVGGPILAKFYPDEAVALDSRLSSATRRDLRTLIRDLPLIGVTSCGVAFTHAAPPDAPFDRETLRDIKLDGWSNVLPWQMFQAGFLGEVLWRRGASEALTGRFLERLNAIDGPASHMVIHGHEVDRAGFEVEAPNLGTLSTSFGMERSRKTILRLDLDAAYKRTTELTFGTELLPLWPDRA
jgi:hypothetical protein